MALATALFGPGVITGGGWRGFMTLATFFVESTLLSWLVGGSLGQLICRIAVVRLDRQPLGGLRAMLRAALVCLALPAVIIGPQRRPPADVVVGTLVIHRRRSGSGLPDGGGAGSEAHQEGEGTSAAELRDWLQGNHEASAGE